MPNMLPVNMGNAAGIAHDLGGRLALFVREADCQRCDAKGPMFSLMSFTMLSN